MKILLPPLPGQAALCLLIIALSSMITGCQEDTRASKLDTQRASEVSDARLKQAQSNLLATLGQSPTAKESQYPADNTGSPRTLAWNPPMTREDGSSLAPGQISGYRIYYRMKHKNDFNIIPLNDASTTRYRLEGMPPGAYEFSITTVDVDGLESRRSDPVEVNLI
ncbi:fibronectin type III domain-containing protein [Marinobacter shengliensis]|uniref:fibronectin type III domain-containing protein n=1 Tax=Marinobacter shengliensis TaxID=1389223 RepID=UPI001108699E|nr:fibronectin type III domain-containing protein [Marinobacter shengliensis]